MLKALRKIARGADDKYHGINDDYVIPQITLTRWRGAGKAHVKAISCIYEKNERQEQSSY